MTPSSLSPSARCLSSCLEAAGSSNTLVHTFLMVLLMSSTLAAHIASSIRGRAASSRRCFSARASGLSFGSGAAEGPASDELPPAPAACCAPDTPALSDAAEGVPLGSEPCPSAPGAAAPGAAALTAAASAAGAGAATAAACCAFFSCSFCQASIFCWAWYTLSAALAAWNWDLTLSVEAFILAAMPPKKPPSSMSACCS
mmetsp:Transcript_11892/g.25535  ORF Transcript_11892/g.25535 Transcript_11892/m.25535 type:complete len:200 (+) Transcript_11892:2588-3187(+)